MLRLLLAVATLVAEHGLLRHAGSVAGTRGLSSCGSRALERPGSIVAAHDLAAPWHVGSSWIRVEPVSHALAGSSLPLGHREAPGPCTVDKYLLNKQE